MNNLPMPKSKCFISKEGSMLTMLINNSKCQRLFYHRVLCMWVFIFQLGIIALPVCIHSSDRQRT